MNVVPICNKPHKQKPTCVIRNQYKIIFSKKIKIHNII